MTWSPLGWVRWHCPELVAAATPATLAVTVHPAWAAVTVGVVGRWWWHEHRHPAPRPPAPPDEARDEGDVERDEVTA